VVKRYPDSNVHHEQLLRLGFPLNVLSDDKPSVVGRFLHKYPFANRTIASQARYKENCLSARSIHSDTRKLDVPVSAPSQGRRSQTVVRRDKEFASQLVGVAGT
jgi:hypothetical protein